MLNFNCLKCGKEYKIEEFKATDTPSTVKISCLCGYVMHVTALSVTGVYEIGTFHAPAAPTFVTPFC